MKPGCLCPAPVIITAATPALACFSESGTRNGSAALRSFGSLRLRHGAERIQMKDNHQGLIEAFPSSLSHPSKSSRLSLSSPTRPSLALCQNTHESLSATRFLHLSKTTTQTHTCTQSETMVATPLIYLGAAVALAGYVSASTFDRELAVRTFRFPDAVPMDKRQASGGQYQCHADCGGTINGAKDGDHCSDNAWRDLLDTCLICVDTYPIWQYYGESVSEAAAACGLTVEPGTPARPSEGGEEEEETPEPSAEPEPTSPPTAAPEASSEPEPTPSTLSEDAERTVAPTRASNETLSEPSHIGTNAGVRLSGTGSVVGLSLFHPDPCSESECVLLARCLSSTVTHSSEILSNQWMLPVASSCHGCHLMGLNTQPRPLAPKKSNPLYPHIQVRDAIAFAFSPSAHTQAQNFTSDALLNRPSLKSRCFSQTRHEPQGLKDSKKSNSRVQAFVSAHLRIESRSTAETTTEHRRNGSEESYRTEPNNDVSSIVKENHHPQQLRQIRLYLYDADAEESAWTNEPKDPYDTIPSLGLVRIMLLDYIVDNELPFPMLFNITPFTNGACNRLFKVEFPEGKEMPEGLPRVMILRFTAPIDPFYQTESEVSTMWWLASKGGVPVPQVFYFDSTAKNATNLEWTLMEYVEGDTLRDLTEKMNPPLANDKKMAIGAEISQHLEHVRDLRFDKIGSLYCDWDTGDFHVGPLVDFEYFEGRRLDFPALRGPFDSISEYFKSLMEIQQMEAIQELENDRKQLQKQLGLESWEAVVAYAKTHPEIKLPVSVRQMVERAEAINDRLMPKLLAYLQRLPTSENGDGKAEDQLGPVDGWHTELMHPDLHMGNVLVAGRQRLQSIVDWDWTTLMPPPLVVWVPYLDSYFQGHKRSKRVPNATALQLREILSPQGLEWTQTDIHKSIIVSETFSPPERYTTPKALALRAVGEVVKNASRLNDEQAAWLSNAIKFLDEEEQVNIKETIVQNMVAK
ncbi:hypothetical protein SODALDRAFT_374409 [Sodiomyces alkalinus F11]|uniref:Aminoglycoside phosphotransferase domain-containing protein n=1 Tax=Sodiomyces alkalinus (strain CBS 110278 / VKM F-3762 / F11) TaxID=1314773 RepID=A0A3N2Q5I2_SODAK|nr:hypothetical protein SODALDRAFT_374409 [Sodiomyces alkalinus F11]ROT42031.1 hypothetical protein SODALDRAFT_374409 [Sodiomyces alkalinus F11]